MALLEGTTAPEMILFPYSNDPDTGSLIPSISTGGAATNAIIKQIAAASRHGIISVPNQPTYKRLLVDVTHEQKSSQFWEAGCLIEIELIIKNQPTHHKVSN
tara:strand:- start:362 stop:667 length:306 start_codon:yes stop_codon:yes gene_type:complete